MKKIGILLFICLCWLNAAYAGTNCNLKGPTPLLFVQAGQQALNIENTLNKLKPKVALLTRVGIDLSRYHLHYSHVAFVIHNDNTNRWDVVHLLSQCKIQTSAIYNQGLMNFYVDDLITLDTRLIIPNQRLQNSLLAILQSNEKLALHTSNYSVIAYPYSTQYQNSNQWVLEVIAAAMSGTNDRSSAQAYLRTHNYQPSYAPVPSAQRLAAAIVKPSAKFDDHPPSEFHSSNYAFVSVDSIINFLTNNHLILFDHEFKDSNTKV